MEDDSIKGVVGCLLASSSAAMYLLIKKQNEKKYKKKRIWMRKRRLEQEDGCFNSPTNEISTAEAINFFKDNLRMTDYCFQEILKYTKVELTKQDTVMRLSVPADEKLAIVLRFLATGESYKSLGNHSRLSQPFISKVVPQVCGLIYKKMGPEFLKFPENDEEWIQISKEFENRYQFPHCVGALDCRHVAFRALRSEGKTYLNSKGINSIILLAMCKADHTFTYVNVGSNGSLNDAEVLNQSDLQQYLNGDFLPKEDNIGNGKTLPYVTIGDEAFPLTKHTMTPFPYNSTQNDEKMFNFRLNHARQTIDHSLNTLFKRFQVLQTNISLAPEKIKKIILACCVLHNFFAKTNRDYMETSTNKLQKPRSESLPETPMSQSKLASQIRIGFKQYFCSEGKLDRQSHYL